MARLIGIMMKITIKRIMEADCSCGLDLNLPLDLDPGLRFTLIAPQVPDER